MDNKKEKTKKTLDNIDQVTLFHGKKTFKDLTGKT